MPPDGTHPRGCWTLPTRSRIWRPRGPPHPAIGVRRPAARTPRRPINARTNSEFDRHRHEPGGIAREGDDRLRGSDRRCRGCCRARDARGRNCRRNVSGKPGRDGAGRNHGGTDGKGVRIGRCSGGHDDRAPNKARHETSRRSLLPPARKRGNFANVGVRDVQVSGPMMQRTSNTLVGADNVQDLSRHGGRRHASAFGDPPSPEPALAQSIRRT